ncbi:pantoate--beta-alanine ligase [Anaeroselena agilis]|uniref:Pantothenate synthetase n=1 Tax=Anaeroselena agilis TaxID=3063788 RepID=A0ABU3P161_9FIRM|nr:pantoate--beta-alanine ligase [Selenomonadales bacterium 4137-cl]
MEIVTRVADVRALVRQARAAGKTVGLVPTMGFLHEGHLTLMRTARAEHGLVIASIFVNPLQFGPNEDYAAYPRDLERDARLAASAGVDAVFAPPVEELYPQGPADMLTFVEVKDITERLCGARRPGHFRGVATVVAKLFNIVRPDVAYFGQKDAQQVVVVRRMAADLSMDVRIATVPIVREKDGLALSSRNVYLNPAERQAATVLSRALRLAEERLKAGQRDAAAIRREMGELIGGEPLAACDYISVCDPATLRELDTVAGPALVALAVRIGKTRLIDNLQWEG